MLYETPTPTSAFPTDLDQRLDAIAYKTSVTRNLPTTELVSHELIDKQEFRKLFLEDLEEDAVELALDTRLYRRLGIIERDADLAQILTDVYADIVLGFYDTDEDKMYLLSEKDEFTLNDRLTVAARSYARAATVRIRHRRTQGRDRVQRRQADGAARAHRG